jgi:hypothetical protein
LAELQEVGHLALAPHPIGEAADFREIVHPPLTPEIRIPLDLVALLLLQLLAPSLRVVTRVSLALVEI